MFIYAIKCTVNNKYYVGYDTGEISAMRRWKLHCALIKPKHESKIYWAMLKHGLSNFDVSIVAEANTMEQLKSLEIEWIKKLDSIKNGYNIRTGGNGFGKLSEMEPEHAAKQLLAIKRGAKKANQIRWANTTKDERRQELDKCISSYSSDDRSRNVKSYWENMTAENKSDLSQKMKNGWKRRKEIQNAQS